MKLRSLLASSLVLILIACGGGGGGAGGAVAQQVVKAEQPGVLNCLTQEAFAAVRAAPAAGVNAAFAVCLPEFSAKTAQLQLTDHQLRVAFASVLAYALTPYGTSGSTSLDALLADKVMDCDNYAMLFGYFARFLAPSATLRFVGYDGGMVGNHAQVFSDDGLLLDPTIGLVAKAGFNEVMMGKPVPDGQFVVFRQHEDASIDGFRKTVLAAVTSGAYKPSDLLYYFQSLDQYVFFFGGLPTLGDPLLDSLVKRFPTPGSRMLQKNLVTAGG